MNFKNLSRFLGFTGSKNNFATGSCRIFFPANSDDRRIYERLVEKGLLERSRGLVGCYQIAGR